MKAGNQARVKALFGRCLLTVLDVALWRAYLKLIAAESKSADAAASPAASPELRQAYEVRVTRVVRLRHVALVCVCHSFLAERSYVHSAVNDERRRVESQLTTT